MLFSIIIPFFNSEKTLEKAIESVLKQSCTNYEIILVNDASTDTSMDIVGNYRAKENVKIISNKKNRLVGYSRNKAIDLADGDYLLFLDSDDFLEGNALYQLERRILKDNYPDIILFGYNEIHWNFNSKCTSYIESLPNTEYISDDFFKDCLLGIKGFTGAPWNCIYSSEIVRKNNIRFAEGIYYEDTIFVIKAIWFAKTFCVLEKVIYNYNCLTLGSIVRNGNEKKIYDLIKCYELIYDFLDETEILDRYKNEYIFRLITSCIAGIIQLYIVSQKEHRNKSLRKEIKSLLHSDSVSYKNLRILKDMAGRYRIVIPKIYWQTFYIVKFIKRFKISFFLSDIFYSSIQKRLRNKYLNQLSQSSFSNEKISPPVSIRCY